MFKMRNSRVIASIALFILIAGGSALYFHHANEVIIEEAKKPVLSTKELYPHKIPRNSSLYIILREKNIPAPTIHQLVKAAKPVKNLGRLLSGTRFQVYYEEPAQIENQEVAQKEKDLKEIHFLLSPTEVLEIKKVEGQWSAEKRQEVIETRKRTFIGSVKSTLWESATEVEMDTQLIMELAEIFAWQVDFAREVRPNDRWRLSVEQKFVRGEAIGWGPILAAEYENDGKSFIGVRYKNGEGGFAYYSPDGTNLRKMFLKSPLRFGRVTSRFQRRRFHPILKVRRPHLGVDYGAPRGTPVRSVGSGRVTFAGRKGGAGKTIKIRHNATYKTAYKHLNGYAKGIKKGARVQQGQVIGYVGSTGLSTAPHLHYEFFYNGRFVDPLKQKFPSAKAVSKELMPEFANHAQARLVSLPAWSKSESDLGKPSERSLSSQ